MVNNKLPEPKVGVIVTNWNGYELTKNCIESLKKVTYSNYEIIVVDNGSQDGSGDKLKREYPDIILIKKQQNLGYAGGSNVGLQYALKNGADYVLILNNDTIVDKNFLSELVKVAESDEMIGITGGKIYFLDSPKLIFSIGGYVQRWTLTLHDYGAWKIDEGQYNELREIQFVSGCCMLVRKTLINDIGIFDENFFFGLEDMDLCLRATYHHYKLMYVPTAKLWHKGYATISRIYKKSIGPGTTPFKHRVSAKSNILILRKHGRWYNFLIGGMARLICTFYTLTGLIILRRWDKLVAHLSGVKEGFLVKLSKN